MAKDNGRFIDFRKTFVQKVRGAFVTKADSFYPDITDNNTAVDIVDIVNSYGGDKSSSDALNFQDRIEEYDEMMRALPELDAIFTFYSDEATMENFLTGKVVWAENKEEDIVKESNLLLDFIKIGYQLPIITYNLAAYGNAYAELSLTKDGVSKIIVHDVKTIRRIELPDGRLLGFARSPNNRSVTISRFREAIIYKNEVFKKKGKISRSHMISRFGFYPYEHFEMVHWRLRKYSATNLYGYSVMDALRGHWRNNVMARTSLIMNKVKSAMPRRMITVEVGKTSNEKDIKRKLRSFQRKFRRKDFMGSNGMLRNGFNPFSELEDLVVPMQEGVPLYTFEEIAAKDIEGKTTDVEYFDNKIDVVSLIPKGILTGSESSRSTLAQESIRFAKRIYNIQQEIVKGIEKMITVHLYLNGYSTQDLLDNPVKVKMNFASDTAKLIQIETMEGLLGYFQSMENIFPLKDRYEKALGVSEKQYKEYKKDLENDLIDAAITESKIEIAVSKYMKENKPKPKKR